MFVANVKTLICLGLAGFLNELCLYYDMGFIF